MNIGEKLRQLRKQIHKLTLREVSERTGLSISFLSDIERGRTNPSLETLSKLADVYKVSISSIIPENNKDNHSEVYPKGFKEAVNELNISEQMQEIMLLVEHRSTNKQKTSSKEYWIRLYYSLKTIMN